VGLDDIETWIDGVRGGLSREGGQVMSHKSRGQ